MKLLAIDTSTRQLGVAVTDGDRLLASFELLAEYPHAAELPGAVTRVLREARVTLKELEAIAVDVGPGSFTGLRIGLAFVKALAFPGRTPVVGVCSLDVLAANLPYAPQPVCPVLDAKQGNVYLATYRMEGEQPIRLSEPRLGKVEVVWEPVEGPVVCVGDGCARYREQILARCPMAAWAGEALGLPRAATLARLGRARLMQGEPDDPPTCQAAPGGPTRSEALRAAGRWGDDPATLVPMYLYPRDCQVRGPHRPTSVVTPPSRVSS